MPQARTLQRKNTIAFKGVEVWNKMNKEEKSVSSKTFKNQLRKK